jgi:RNA polymerase sigma-70 factor (ECF subfamily)
VRDVECPRVGQARSETGTEAEERRTQRAVVAARAGRPEGIEYLYLRYAPQVRRFVTRLCGDAHEADDVTQIVFLRLPARLARYEPRDVGFESWLLTVARNTTLDELRRRRRVSTGDVPPRAVGADPPSDRAPLFAALRMLPRPQREVAVLRLVVGLSPDETAAHLERTTSSVNNLHHRARANLRRSLVALNAAPCARGRVREVAGA